MGFWAVELLLPSPKSHDHAVGEPVDWSLKLTGKGALPKVGATLPPQPVDATHALNLSAGVSNPKVLRDI